MDIDVLIVGAGACGLMAARELSKAGKKVLMLEARDRIGGRILPLSEEAFGYPAQGGAEFVHGEAPVTRKLIDEAGLTLIHPIPWWEMRDGEVPVVIEPVVLHGDALQTKLAALTKDEPVYEFMEREFPGEEHKALREMTYRRIEGYDAAEPKRKSAFALREDLNNENAWVQKSIQEGYGALLRFLEKECMKFGVDVRLNARVVRVEHSSSGVRAVCADETTYNAKKIFVTAPLSLLQEIEFVPAIPEKLEAAGRIGYGSVIKIVIRFKEKWWTGAREHNFERMFFLFSSEKIPTWWTQYPEMGTARDTLTGWLAGPKVHALAEHSDQELFDIALTSLSNIFKISVEDLRRQVVTSKALNWEKDAFAKGGYSYTTPETDDALKVLGEPVNAALYFGGEAFGGNANATVEGAFASGQEIARKMLG